jgi:hypothetical protein
MVSTIGRQDVMLVASSIKKNLTEQQIGQVLSMYNHEEESDPTATWNLIVENCIYQVIDDKKTVQ